MVQRWLKTLAILSVSATLFTACQKSEYSKDEPLEPVNTPSLFIGSQNRYLYALKPETGEKKWEFNVGSNIIATPAVVSNKFLIVVGENVVYKLNVHNGKIEAKWDNFGEGFTGFVASPYVFGNTVYLATTNGKVFAINGDNSEQKWTYDAGAPIHAAPTLYNGQLIVAASDKVHAINVLNGTPSWTTPLPVSTSAPVVSAPYVYVGGSDGTLYALDVSTGVVSWTYDPTPDPSTIMSPPVVYGGNVIFGCSDYNLYCIDSIAKQPRWVIKTEQRINGAPFAKDQIVYFGSYDFYFYAVDIIDGVVKWKYKTGKLVQSSPLVHQSTVYVGGYDKMLYAFDTSGSLRWKRDIDGAIETSPVLFDLSKTHYPAVTGFNEQVPQ